MVFWESVCGFDSCTVSYRPGRLGSVDKPIWIPLQPRGEVRVSTGSYHLIHPQTREAAATQRTDYIGSPQPWHLSFQTSLLQLFQTIKRFYSFITLQVAQIAVTTSIPSITRTVYEFKAPHNWLLLTYLTQVERNVPVPRQAWVYSAHSPRSPPPPLRLPLGQPLPPSHRSRRPAPTSAVSPLTRTTNMSMTMTNPKSPLLILILLTLASPARSPPWQQQRIRIPPPPPRRRD